MHDPCSGGHPMIQYATGVTSISARTRERAKQDGYAIISYRSALLLYDKKEINEQMWMYQHTSKYTCCGRYIRPAPAASLPAEIR